MSQDRLSWASRAAAGHLCGTAGSPGGSRLPRGCSVSAPWGQGPRPPEPLPPRCPVHPQCRALRARRARSPWLHAGPAAPSPHRRPLHQLRACCLSPPHLLAPAPQRGPAPRGQAWPCLQVVPLTDLPGRGRPPRPQLGLCASFPRCPGCSHAGRQLRPYPRVKCASYCSVWGHEGAVSPGPRTRLQGQQGQNPKRLPPCPPGPRLGLCSLPDPLGQAQKILTVCLTLLAHSRSSVDASLGSMTGSLPRGSARVGSLTGRWPWGTGASALPCEPPALPGAWGAEAASSAAMALSGGASCL